VLYTPNAVHRLDRQADALSLLTPWFAFWRQGQSLPLPFFGRTSLAYARIRFYCTKREICRLGFSIRKTVEEGRFTNVRQAYDSTLKSHYILV
jgi:exonuclease V gamma subunit